MIPVVLTTVPSTLGAALASNIPAVTAEAVIGTTTTGTTGVARSSTANLSTEELIKLMEDMKLQVSKLNKVKATQEEVQRTKAKLGKMPEEANKLIHFLNIRNKEHLEELGINNGNETILEIKRVLTKKTLMQNLERRYHDMQAKINAFMEKFDILQGKGLPSPLVINHILMRHKDYVEKLNKYAGNHAGSSTSASGIKALPTGRVLYDSLENLFYVEHELKHLFPIQPTFFRYTETDETLRKIQKTRIPHRKWWEEMLEIL